MKINEIRETIKVFENNEMGGCQFAKWLVDLIDCRNELCDRCGKYKSIGACDGCRWEKED